jgi:REP element-mobilizing transposase RayT
LQQLRRQNILACMRIVDPETGRSYLEKRRVRYNEPGQPRELTFSCYRHFAFLGRDRTREWLCNALDEARTEFDFQFLAYVLMPEHVHVLAYPGDTAHRMSRFLQAVKEPVARKAIHYLKNNAPKWLAPGDGARRSAREAPFLAAGRRLRPEHHEHGSAACGD